jgi:tyrocidine synthetase-3
VVELAIVTPEERHAQLFEFNAGAVDLGNDRPINVRFEAQARQHPDQPAVIHHSCQWTYAQLNQKANQMAAVLKRQGLKPGDFVGVHLERSPVLLAAILAVLKAGGAYVPLDTQNPASRTRELMASSQIRVLITDSHCLTQLDGYERGTPDLKGFLCVDEVSASVCQALAQTCFSLRDQRDLEVASEDNPMNVNALESWAYMLYTSGSTGRPKGAITRHDGALNHILAEFEALQLADGFRFLQSAGIASDISVWQLLAPVLKGGTVIIIDKEDLLDYEKLIRTLQVHRVNLAEFVPSYLLGLADYLSSFSASACAMPDLQWMMMVGEEVPVKLVNQWLQLVPGCRVLNGYGPCEASDDIAQFVVTQLLPPSVNKVPIGRPIANMNIFILDQHHQLLPTGVAGELCVSGVGVGAGYWQDPEKTARKFIPNPFTGTLGATLYKTGDLARWDPDGYLAFMGRIDHQVKIRGYRVELGEIESCLRTHPAVQDAAVLLRLYQGEKQAIAYIVAHDPDFWNTETAAISARKALKLFLSGQLADYMHPAEYVFMERFPLNLSDKVDRKALPDPASVGARRERLAPGNETEAQLLRIWQKILEREVISTDDNFFEIGGHSLKATRLMAHANKVFNAHLSLRTIFAQPTIRELSRHILSGSARYQPIPKAPVQETYPLSHAQQRLWLVNQLSEGQYNYNMPDAFFLRGTLRIGALQQAFRHLVARHESLRTVFMTVQGQPRQQVLPALAELPLSVGDVRDHEQPVAEAIRLATTDAQTVFDLEKGPLFKASLLQTGEGEYLLVFVAHHIITDGWSSGVILRDLLQAYQSEQQPVPNERLPLPIQYKDFAVWQAQQLAQDGDETGRTSPSQSHRAYWLEQFAEAVTPLELPTDFARRAHPSQQGATLEWAWDLSLTDQLKALGNRQGVSLFMVVLTAIKVLLYRYTGQEDLVVGTVAAGREHSDLEDQVGFYVNTLALRTRVKGNESFAQLLDQVKAVTLGAYEHQAYPFDQLVDDLGLERDLSRSPLFDVLVAMQNNQEGDDLLNQIPGLEVQACPLEQNVSKFDLTIEIWEQQGRLHAALEYNTDLFTPARIERMGGHLSRLLEVMVGHVHTPINRIDYLRPEERRELLATGEAHLARLPDGSAIHRTFEAAAEARPDALALVDESRQFTYGQLNRRANQLAQYLLATQGTGPGQLVAVVMARGAEFVVAMLAALKTGAGYLPLESHLPVERIQALIQQTKAQVLLTDAPTIQASLRDTLPAVWVGETDLSAYAGDNLSVPVGKNELAYVMFTSGSTGQPKAVMIPHRGVVRLVKDTDYIRFDERDRVLQTGALSFDAATFEIWGALLNGATLHMVPFENLLDTQALSRVIRERGITKMLFITSLFNQLADAHPELFRPLQLILVGGEALSPLHVAKVKQVCPDLKILNAYGPTENTTISICGEVPFPLTDTLALGRPIRYSTAYLVDRYGQLVPKGIPGEILLGGEGLATAYMHDPERTAESLIPHPFQPGEKLYKSGDLGVWLEDGRMAFLGRVDEQVKIRGYRVEPGEIAHVLCRHPSVNEAVVLANKNAKGQKFLIGYFTEAQTVSAEVLKAFLKAQLPDYMVPALLVRLDRMPINKNGKLDRRALPSTDETLELRTEKTVPANPVERQLIHIWEEVLGVSGIGTMDNFFEAGGNSLKATQILSDIQTTFGCKLNLATFFRNPEIRSLALLLAQPGQALTDRIPQIPTASRYEVSRAQKGLWIMDQLEEEKSAYNLAGAYEIHGQVAPLTLEAAIRLTLARHEILRTVFEEWEGTPFQRILPAENLDFRLPIIHIDETSRIGEVAQALLREEQSHVFRLDEGPLVRFRFLTNGERQFLIVNLHHIIGDGGSLLLLQHELVTHYQALKGERSVLPAPLTIQYKDFAAWQNQQLAAGGQADESYWLAQLAGSTHRPDLPIDQPRTRIRQYQSRVSRFDVPSSIATQFAEMAQARSVSLFVALQTLVKALLKQYTRTEEIFIGTPISGRDHPDLANQLGVYVNMLVLRDTVLDTDSFDSLLMKVQQTTLAAFEHPRYPFDLLVEKLKLRRDLSRNPLFDVCLTLLEEGSAPEPSISDASARLVLEDVGTADNQDLNKYDLTFAFESHSMENLRVEIIYNHSLFFDASVEQLKNGLLALIEAVVQAPQAPLPTRMPSIARQPEALLLEDDFN